MIKKYAQLDEENNFVKCIFFDDSIINSFEPIDYTYIDVTEYTEIQLNELMQQNDNQ